MTTKLSTIASILDGNFVAKKYRIWDGLDRIKSIWLWRPSNIEARWLWQPSIRIYGENAI
jgi:hypothetical protein